MISFIREGVYLLEFRLAVFLSHNIFFSVLWAVIRNTKINISQDFMNLSLCAAELFVNGEIVQRSPERQRRVEPVPQRAQDRPRYSDRTRYVKRRENQSYQR
jgi:predicted nucleic acid-binding protein